jgi:hypothetical protein
MNSSWDMTPERLVSSDVSMFLTRLAESDICTPLVCAISSSSFVVIVCEARAGCGKRWSCNKGTCGAKFSTAVPVLVRPYPKT